MKCKICQKEFDSSYDFIENIEALEALTYFVETESICSKCSYDLLDDITEFANNRVLG